MARCSFPNPCRRSSPGSAAAAAPNTPWPNGLTPSIAGKESRPAAAEPGDRPGFPGCRRRPGAIPRIAKEPIPIGEQNMTLPAAPRNLPCPFGFCSFGGHSIEPQPTAQGFSPAARCPVAGQWYSYSDDGAAWLRMDPVEQRQPRFPLSRNRNRSHPEAQPEQTDRLPINSRRRNRSPQSPPGAETAGYSPPRELSTRPAAQHN